MFLWLLIDFHKLLSNYVTPVNVRQRGQDTTDHAFFHLVPSLVSSRIIPISRRFSLILSAFS